MGWTTQFNVFHNLFSYFSIKESVQGISSSSFIQVIRSLTNSFNLGSIPQAWDIIGWIKSGKSFGSESKYNPFLRVLGLPVNRDLFI